MPVFLSELRPGMRARLHHTRLDTGTRSLLRSLGLTDDARIHVCLSGDPCVIEVRGTRLGISNAVARCILVVDDAYLDGGTGC